MNDYGRPLRLFVMNLYAMGFRLWVEPNEDGAPVLCVKGPEGYDPPTPVLAAEIEKRARFLVDILKPFPAGPIQKFYGRLLSRDEKEEALQEAVKHGYTFTATPAWLEGWWLIEVRE